MDTTPTRRERKKQETRQRLMEAALRLFHEQGYDATTVEQIAEAADVAKGTFFNYFETKEALLPALFEWRMQELAAALLPERGAPASPVARIKLALHLMASDPLADQTLAQQLFTAIARQRLPPEVAPVQPLIDLLAGQIRQAQEAGEVRTDLDAVYLACVIRALFFQQMLLWHCGYHPAPLPEALDAAVDLLLEGIAGPKWKPTGRRKK